MPNQRDIARVLGVNQATVSLALRGDPAIPTATQRRIKETALRLGYRPNAYVSSLMAHIRSGRKPSEEGVIALLVEAKSQQEWHEMESYRLFHQGIAQRAEELGFRTETFYLKAPRMSLGIVDRILEARGIRGALFTPPYRDNRPLSLHWERCACLGLGHGWEGQPFDRVANDHPRNVLRAFRELERLGYRRIGLFLSGIALVGGRGLKWISGYLEAQHLLAPERRLPLFTGSLERGDRAEFLQWKRRWRPDALLTLTGREKPILDAMKIKDVALACLVRPRDSSFAGIDEQNETIGAAAAELIASQIARNQFGLPAHPKLTLIEGRWLDGPSAPHRDEQLRH